MRNSGQIAKGGIDIQMGNQSVDHLASGETAGPAHDQRDAPAVILEVALHQGERHAVIRGADDERIAGEPVAVQRIENLADGAIHVSRAGVKRGRIEAGFRSIGDRRRGKRVAWIVRRRRLGIFAVSLEEADIQEEGRAVSAAQEFHSAGGDIGSRSGFGMKNLVEADDLRIGGYVLQTCQHRTVPGRTERVQDVLVVIVQTEAAMRQAQHPVAVRALAGEESRPAGRARRSGAERAAEQHSLAGQALQIRRRDSVPERLQVAAGIVRMQINDVGFRGLRARLGAGNRGSSRGFQQEIAAGIGRSRHIQLL